MKIKSIELTNFRNYQNEKVIFGSEKNFFLGRNAQGKTNLLEAIFLLCLSKSFRTAHEKEAISFSQDQFIIKGEFESDSGINRKVVFLCSKNSGKELSVNRKRINRISEFIGNIPVIISSPDEYSLTTGPPTGRRRFIDILLSQIDKKYIHILLEYQRIIKQKNKILQNWKLTGKKNFELIDPWNEQLVKVGSKIIELRNKFSIQLSEKLKKIHSDFVINDEKLEFSYRPNLDYPELENISLFFNNKLKQSFTSELQRGISLVGPHRDDFIFKINKKNLKKFGSRGQHKTVLISLAIAEYQIIEELAAEKPIVLIDDLYSELDQTREKKIIQALEKMGQIFISSTELNDNYIAGSPNKYFNIQNGSANEQ